MAALVEGVGFIKNRGGYWLPKDIKDNLNATEILEELAKLMGYGGGEEGKDNYLIAMGSNDFLQRLEEL